MKALRKTLVLLCFALCAVVEKTAARDTTLGSTDKPASSHDASRFFGLTNLWTFHLKIDLNSP